MKHHSTATTLLLVLLTLGMLAGPVVAQEGNTTSTSAAPANASGPSTAPTMVGDDALHIVDAWMSDGTMHVKLYAEQVRRVSVSAPPSQDASGGYVRTPLIEEGETQVVTIPSPTSTVWLSTPQSVDNGRFHEIDASGPGLIPAPFDGSDVFYAGAGAAVAVALAVLYEAVRAEHGEPETGERLA